MIRKICFLILFLSSFNLLAMGKENFSPVANYESEKKILDDGEIIRLQKDFRSLVKLPNPDERKWKKIKSIYAQLDGANHKLGKREIYLYNRFLQIARTKKEWYSCAAIFERIEEKKIANCITYNTMIGVYRERKLINEADQIFRKACQENNANTTTFRELLKFTSFSWTLDRLYALKLIAKEANIVSSDALKSFSNLENILKEKSIYSSQRKNNSRFRGSNSKNNLSYMPCSSQAIYQPKPYVEEIYVPSSQEINQQLENLIAENQVMFALEIFENAKKLGIFDDHTMLLGEIIDCCIYESAPSLEAVEVWERLKPNCVSTIQQSEDRIEVLVQAQHWLQETFGHINPEDF